MSLPALIAIGLGFALTAYAVLAGADFGAGILDLTFGHSPEQRTRTRADDRTAVGGKPCLADLLDHDPVLRFSDRIRGARDGPFGVVHARRDGDRRTRGRFQPAHGGVGSSGPQRRAARPGVRSREHRRTATVRRIGGRARAGVELDSRSRHRLLTPLDGAVRRHRRAARGGSVRTPRRDVRDKQARARADRPRSRIASAGAACRRERPCSPSASSRSSRPPGKRRRCGTA